MSAPRKEVLSDSVTLWLGDCLEVLKTMADNSVDAVVTDPPYGLEFMGKDWDGSDGFRRSLNKADVGRENVFGRQSARGPEYRAGELFQEWCEAWAREVLRVLKPGGHLASFSSTRTYHRMACAIEDAGFEVRDQLAWTYGQGFPKSMDISKAIDKAAGVAPVVVGEKEVWGNNAVGGRGGQYANGFAGAADGTRKSVPITAPATDAARQWEGWGTALKPAWEPICLARKPLSEKTVAANVLRWGTGAINVGACKIETETPRPARDRHKDAALDATRNTYGTGLNGSRAVEDTMTGRFPANLCHDGSDEVLELFPETGAAKSGARGGSNPNPMDWGNERSDGSIVKGHDDNGGSAARYFYCAKASKSDRAGSKHPTVKPVKLMQWLCRLITPTGGVVLDPFAGSGTTGAAAIAEGFRAILIEREGEYHDDIRRRIVERPRISFEEPIKFKQECLL
jgi:DNA modification methylase